MGGITGRVENRSNSNWRSVSNCLNLGAVSGGQYVGGLNGSSAYCNTTFSYSSAALSLCAGDGAYLVASPLPAVAPIPILSWASSRPEVAQVNKDGRVTAAAPGQAIITAATADGAYSAQCTVTVSARSQDEYVLGPITLEDQQGTALTAIPRGPFWATVPVTNRTSTGSAMLLLASYDAGGHYLGLLCSRVEGLNTGATVRLSLLLDNSGGSIASLKAFLIPSLANLTPIGPCARFG